MKHYFCLLVLLPVFCFAQKTSIYNYHEKGDSVFVNSRLLVRGDTLHLGCGINEDRSFNYIWQVPGGGMNGASAKLRYLSKTYCNSYLIYAGRVDEGFGMMKLYYPVFYDPRYPKVKYNVLFLKAIERGEIKGF